MFGCILERLKKSNSILVCATKESWNRKSNYDPGKGCVFPFKYKGIEYTECTDVDSVNDGNRYFWCATKINEDKEIAEDGRNWGECNDYCRRHGILNLALENI